MKTRYSLAFLTVKEAAPVDAVRIASETGYDYVGFRLTPAGNDGPYSLLTDLVEQRQVKAALEEYDVGVADVEIVRLNECFAVEPCLPFLEVGAYLGARHVLIAGDDTDRSRLIDNYGIFLEHAAQYGLTGDLEFMPWTAVKTSTDCLEIIRAVNKSNSGILVDALHWDRSDRKIEVLKQIPESLVNYIQLCDAPRLMNPTTEQLIQAARSERLVPGSGEIDLKGMISSLPSEKVYSVEVPRDNDSLTKSAHIRAEEALFAAKSIVEGIA